MLSLFEYLDFFDPKILLESLEEEDSFFSKLASQSYNSIRWSEKWLNMYLYLRKNRRNIDDKFMQQILLALSKHQTNAINFSIRPRLMDKGVDFVLKKNYLKINPGPIHLDAIEEGENIIFVLIQREDDNYNDKNTIRHKGYTYSIQKIPSIDHIDADFTSSKAISEVYSAVDKGLEYFFSHNYLDVDYYHFLDDLDKFLKNIHPEEEKIEEKKYTDIFHSIISANRLSDFREINSMVKKNFYENFDKKYKNANGFETAMEALKDTYRDIYYNIAGEEI